MTNRHQEPENPGPEFSSELIPLLYAELKRLAAARLQREPTGVTLTPTSLVHEAYLRIAGSPSASEPKWNSPGHFFGAAAIAMRRILVERARQRRQFVESSAGCSEKSGPLWAIETRSGIDILDLNEALPELEVAYPRAHQVVMLRFFAGLDGAELATVVGVSEPTVKRDWRFARAWLLDRLQRPSSAQSDQATPKEDHD